jgi:hypothetical protein
MRVKKMGLQNWVKWGKKRGLQKNLPIPMSCDESKSLCARFPVLTKIFA